MPISVTSVFCSFLRGFHSKFESPTIFNDAYALEIIPEERLNLITQGFNNIYSNLQIKPDGLSLNSFISDSIQNMPTTAQVLSRSKYAEHKANRFIQQNNSQIVILGSGLDTFSLRHINESNLRIYELDMKETLEFKKEQVSRINKELPRNTNYIPIDLSNQNLFSIMKSSTININYLCFISILGLLMYLPVVKIEILFQSLDKFCSPGSIIVFDYFDEYTFCSEKSSVKFQHMMAQSEITGEQYKSVFDYNQISSLASKYNFFIQEHLSPNDIENLYFTNRKDSYHACEHVHFITLEKMKH